MSVARCAALTLALLALLLTACAAQQDRLRVQRAWDQAYQPRMQALESDSALLDYAARNRALMEERRNAARRAACRGWDGRGPRPFDCNRPRRDGVDEMEFLDRIEVTGSRISAADVITNNQEPGVDEGDIVKKSGDFLLLLRRGMLFSVCIVCNGRPGLETIDRLNLVRARQGGSSGFESADVSLDEDIWYDEILVLGDQLVLLGFDYDEDAARLIGVRMQADGRLEPEWQYAVRTEDYYSGTNYGARLHGDSLVLRFGERISPGGGLRWPQWRSIEKAEWQDLFDAQRIFIPPALSSHPYLHLVLRCPLADLRAGRVNCSATGVVGEAQVEFYVVDDFAYLALPTWNERLYLDPTFTASRYRWGRETTLADARMQRYTWIARVPLRSDEALGIARVAGEPGSQFSFKQVGNALYLATELDARDGREVLLHRLGEEDFDAAAGGSGELLATLALDNAQRSVRLTGAGLWIGAHSDVLLEDGRVLAPSELMFQPFERAPVMQMPLEQSVDRIEPAHGHVLTFGHGRQGEWRVTAITDSDAPRVVGDLVIERYASAEERSHAFNWGTVAGQRLFGLPGMASEGAGPASPAQAWNEQRVSDLLLFRLDGSGPRALGSVDMQRASDAPADCGDYCWDWYGNARLFFVGERIFALSADQLVESRLRGGQLHEVARIRLSD
jgi:hypothetical protein